MELLTGDEYSSIRWKAAEALAKIGPPAVEPLITALSHPNDDVRWKAAIALGEIGDVRATDPLIDLLKDSDRFIKGRAAYALGKIGSPAVVPLITALETGDGSLRWGAVIALGKIRDERAIRPLIQALGDRYENVRSEAIAALGLFGDAIRDPLLEAMQQPDLSERLKLATTIAEAAHSTAWRILTGADPEYRKKLVASLAELNSADLSPFIRVLTGDPAKSDGSLGTP
jgi:HEAT repeat protein